MNCWKFMISKIIFCFSLILCMETSCRDNVTVCKSNLIDSSYRYSIEEFEKLSSKIENRKLDIVRLKCKFKSVFYTTGASDSTVNFVFVLGMSSGTIDTCWGVINYDTKNQIVNNSGVFCQ
jgi:hypothetical protein